MGEGCLVSKRKSRKRQRKWNLKATLLVGLIFESLAYFIITFMLRDKAKDNPKIVDYW